jgi:alpha-beta hydrolase superfamily lysophospholipase
VFLSAAAPQSASSPTERLVIVYGAELAPRRAPARRIKNYNVCLVHGVCEHTGRYDRVAEALTSARYVVSAFDLRGHGKSSGARGDTRFAAAMDDIEALVPDGRAHAASRRVFLYVATPQ